VRKVRKGPPAQVILEPAFPFNREGKGREGKGREGKGREGKGREGEGKEGREGKGREGREPVNATLNENTNGKNDWSDKRTNIRPGRTAAGVADYDHEPKLLT